MSEALDTLKAFYAIFLSAGCANPMAMCNETQQSAMKHKTQRHTTKLSNTALQIETRVFQTTLHEVLDFHTPGKNSPRALGVWPAHENGHMMSVGTRGNYVWALGAHR